MKKILCCAVFVSLATSAHATRPECQSLADKLDNIQAQQRLGYGAEKGKKLAEREKKAREKWWNCQNKRTKNKRKVKKKKQDTPSQASEKSNSLLSHPTGPLTNTIRISSKYKGRKQQMWLDYYQQPEQCEKPKRLNIFAFCMEDRQKQQQEFEQELLANKE
ncbi:hypothetical protein [Thalassotalea marina]|uniref:Secreted protein n=1 Tax=Thalassotalea marina TaxID=1673741 RepID=A0A919BA43_9GAMM|nr:hypothetical protein [Thalassotalea marina]GHF78183.1 hypothetical protein GCM10017161_01530 [Thalassotalea marina]